FFTAGSRRAGECRWAGAPGLREEATCHRREAANMSNPFPAIRQAVQEIIDAEWENQHAGIHRAGGRRAGPLRERDERMTALRKLLAQALPVGINAGFRGETVEGRLTDLGQAVEALMQWDRTMLPHPPSAVAYLDPDEAPTEWHQIESLDNQAEEHLSALAM